MTALKQYEKLESVGLWRETPDAQRVEVYVSFGDTSLVIRDKNEAPLSHWSLPAVKRLNPGEVPALFSPTSEAAETLELDDDIMIDAIERIRAMIERDRPHPGRLRLISLLVVVIATAMASALWLPGTLARHAASVVPPETRRQIGEATLARLSARIGTPCSTLAGQRALRQLGTRLGLDEATRIIILPGTTLTSAALPGGMILLNRRLVENFDQPEVAAGYVLLERVQSMRRSPLERLLDSAGFLVSLRLLTTGRIEPSVLDAYASSLLSRPTRLPDTSLLLAAFARARLPAAPLARSLASGPGTAPGTTAGTTAALIEGDPLRGKTYQPLLSDAAWLRLQAICLG